MQPSLLFVRVIIPGTYTSPRSSRTNMYPILKPRMPATGSRKRSKPHNMTCYHSFHLRCLQSARQSSSFLCSLHPNHSSATNMAPNIIPPCSRPWYSMKPKIIHNGFNYFMYPGLVDISACAGPEKHISHIILTVININLERFRSHCYNQCRSGKDSCKLRLVILLITSCRKDFPSPPTMWPQTLVISSSSCFIHKTTLWHDRISKVHASHMRILRWEGKVFGQASNRYQ